MQTKRKNLDRANGKATAVPVVVVEETIVIPAPKLETIEVTLKGITPLVCRNWDEKAMNEMLQKHEGKVRAKARENKDPKREFNAARYIALEGWDGVPATAFKAALVSAVRCANIPKADLSLKLAKMSFFVATEGQDKVFGADLVRILDAKPEVYRKMCRTSTGAPYICFRPMYRQWRVKLRISYNAGIMDRQQVVNLIQLAGFFVGVGEHRPSSPQSETGNFGRWELEEKRAK